VKWKTDALSSLILPKPQKRLLHGLVTGHVYPESARDESRLKGKGLVVLLHGSPGSGKTLTAGTYLQCCFAEIFAKRVFKK
jgi:DNA polymerase III delta prime subunit